MLALIECIGYVPIASLLGMLQIRGLTVVHRALLVALAPMTLLASPHRASAEPPAPLLKPVELGDETYTESFVVIADLEDGSYVKTQLGVSNAGPGDGKGACRIYIAEKTGSPLSKSTVVERSAWKWSETPKPTLAMGSTCQMTAGPDQLAAHATIEGATLDITLEGSAGASRRAVHGAKSSSGFYDLEVLVPWGNARATFARPGEKPRTVSGFGYADHSRANALPKKTAREWVRFRALNKDASQLILVRFPPDDQPFVGWRWAQPAKEPSPLTRVAVTPGHSDGDRTWKVMLDGDGGPWRIISKKLIQRDAPLEESGAAGGLLGTLIGNPVTYTFRAVLESKLHPGPVNGLLEVTLTDE